jgi:hypothetical protein
VAAFELLFLAPVPVGHRVHVVKYERLTTPLFGNEGRWEPSSSPLLVDLDTGIVYCDERSFTGFDGRTFRAGNVFEGRVTSCIVHSSDTGESNQAVTKLVIEPLPQGGYRG